MPISEKSRLILEAIAKGHTHEQILVQELAWTYHDIFAAAAEALGRAPTPPPATRFPTPKPPANATTTPAPAYSLDEIRSEHANAYRPWNPDEEAELHRLHAEGLSVDAISQQIGRQSGGVRSRLKKLGLIQ